MEEKFFAGGGGQAQAGAFSHGPLLLPLPPPSVVGGGGASHGGGGGGGGAAGGGGGGGEDMVEFNLSQFADASASGGGGVSATRPPGEPVSLKRIRMEHDKSDFECWGCKLLIGSRTFSKTDTALYHLSELAAKIDKANGAGEFETLCRNIAKYHVWFAGRCKERKKACIAWPIDIVRAHFTSHISTSSACILEMQRELRLATQELGRSNFRLIDGERVPHPANYQLWLKSVAALKSISYGDRTKLL